jgi:hypothetical protein
MKPTHRLDLTCIKSQQLSQHTFPNTCPFNYSNPRRRAGLEAVLRRQIARQGVTRLLRCQRREACWAPWWTPTTRGCSWGLSIQLYNFGDLRALYWYQYGHVCLARTPPR